MDVSYNLERKKWNVAKVNQEGKKEDPRKKSWRNIKHEQKLFRNVDKRLEKLSVLDLVKVI